MLHLSHSEWQDAKGFCLLLRHHTLSLDAVFLLHKR